MKEYFCPKCGKKGTPYMAWDRSMFEYSWERFEIPHFLCGSCRLACFDRALVRKTVLEWWHRMPLRKKVPFKVIYEKTLVFIDEFMKEDAAAYKFVRFKKNDLR